MKCHYIYIKTSLSFTLLHGVEDVSTWHTQSALPHEGLQQHTESLHVLALHVITSYCKLSVWTNGNRNLKPFENAILMFFLWEEGCAQYQSNFNLPCIDVRVCILNTRSSGHCRPQYSPVEQWCLTILMPKQRCVTDPVKLSTLND